MATLTFLEGPLEALRWVVTHVHGVEALSAHYRFEVTAVCARDEALAATHDVPLEASAVGRPVRLTFDDDGVGARFGVVGAVTVVGVAPLETYGEEAVEVRLDVVPRAAALALRTRSRVFQGRYAHEVVSEVLAEHGVRHRWALKNVYLRRVYCVQYQETDWDFVARLLAEEGIFFYFLHGAFAGDGRERGEAPGAWEQARRYAGYARNASYASSGMGGTVGAVAGASALVADVISAEGEDERDEPRVPAPGRGGPEGEGEVLTFVDDAIFYARKLTPDALDPTLAGERLRELTLRAHDPTVDDPDALTAFQPRRVPRAARVELRDVYFKSPLAVHEARCDVDAPELALGAKLEHYAHHAEHERPDVSAENARNALEALRADAATFSARGRQWALAPGVRVALHNDTHALVRDGRYAVTRVEHTWRARGATLAGAPRATYENALELVESAVPARPPRPARAPRATTELATVVGPAGQEVFTDRFGRVRAQFHWDREGRFHEGSSCWIRVAQPWAGAGFGVQFVPRVGMEVVVAFVGGDPDRPVITGALYNGTHPTPEALPEHATRSGIRTQTVPGGGGFNELTFEDARGFERVSLHAERALDVDVGGDHRTAVRGAQLDTVMGDRAVAVAGEQRHGVGGARAVTVGGGDSAFVGGDRSATVEGSATDHVRGNAHSRTGGSRFDVVAGAAARLAWQHDATYAPNGRSAHVGGESYAAQDVTRVAGDASTLVDGSLRLAAGLDADREDPTLTAEVGASALMLTREFASLGGGEDAYVVADSVSLTTTDGSAGIVLSGGEVQVWGAKVTLRSGEGAVVVEGGVATVRAASRVRLESPDIGMTGGGGGASDSAQSTETRPEPNLRLLLSHGRWRDGVGLVVGGTVCRVVMGAIARDVPLARDGELDLHVPEGVRRVEVTAPLLFDDDPTGFRDDERTLRWEVNLADEEPDVGTAEGVRWRLADLGYEVGRLRGGALDATTREALRRFQRDQRLAVTGEADDATTRRLGEVYAP